MVEVLSVCSLRPTIEPRSGFQFTGAAPALYNQSYRVACIEPSVIQEYSLATSRGFLIVFEDWNPQTPFAKLPPLKCAFYAGVVISAIKSPTTTPPSSLPSLSHKRLHLRSPVRGGPSVAALPRSHGCHRPGGFDSHTPVSCHW